MIDLKDAATSLDLAICLECRRPLSGSPACLGCGAVAQTRGGVLHAIGPLEGRNAVAAAFYAGPGWTRFRPWEHAFLWTQGGPNRGRRQILRHLPKSTYQDVLVLEVGVGDGDNIPLLDPRARLHGVDLALPMIDECLRKHPSQNNRLALAEAERLPYADAVFDACYSIGGFNYFRDHEAALAEMRRVVKPGGTLIVADERPDLFRFGLGHLIGRPGFDAWWLEKLGLNPEFVAMVLSFQVDLPALFARVWPAAESRSIWSGLGYCYIDRRAL